MGDDWEQTSDIEAAIRGNFKQLATGFQQLDNLDDRKKPPLLKDLTAIMQDCKRQIKEFEREARTDGMPPKILSEKKRQLVQELNTYIALKKTNTTQLLARNNLMEGGAAAGNGAGPSSKQNANDNLGNKQLIEMGRREIKETDDALERARRVVEDTIGLGAQTAATLSDQTKQMEGVLNDLDDITFNMKKAQKVIGEITRGLATDKCIICLMVMILLGIIAGVIVSIVVQPSSSVPPPPPPLPGSALGSETPSDASPSPPPASRRMLIGREHVTGMPQLLRIAFEIATEIGSSN